MEQIARIYVPPVIQPIIGYRAYYDPKTKRVLEITCGKDLPGTYIDISEQQGLHALIGEWFVESGELKRKTEASGLRLKLKKDGVTFASVRGHQQIPVPLDWTGDKDTWDATD